MCFVWKQVLCILTLVMLLVLLLWTALIVFGPLALAGLTFTGKNIRLPLVAGFAQKMAGLDADWEDA